MALREPAEAAELNQLWWRQLAEERILDAQALILSGRWAYAYYVAGYAVECGLKACMLARMAHTGWIFKYKGKVEDCLKHGYKQLINIAGLIEELDNMHKESAAAGGEFIANWQVVCLWNVDSRYAAKTEDSRYAAKTEAEARALLAAITDEPHGVLPWIRNYW